MLYNLASNLINMQDSKKIALKNKFLHLIMPFLLNLCNAFQCFILYKNENMKNCNSIPALPMTVTNLDRLCAENPQKSIYV